MRKRYLRTRLKKNLFADLLAGDIVQEIETLLGRQAVEELDLEALELAVRQQVLQLAARAVEQRLNANTSDELGSRSPAAAAGKRILPDAAANSSTVCSGRCAWSGPTITAPLAVTAAVPAIDISEWSTPPCLPHSRA